MSASLPSTAGLPEDPHEAAAVLLQRVANDGDRDAFSELYDRFACALLGTILTIVRDRAEAEDTLQECFCSIWDHADQYHVDRGKAVSWMMTIARNKAYDHVAKAQRRGQIVHRVKEEDLEAKPAGISTEDGFDVAVVNEERLAVSRALEDLPEDQRQAIQLAFLKGMTQLEVAESLGQPLGTIKARIRRGLFHLRGTLQPYLAGPAS